MSAILALICVFLQTGKDICWTQISHVHYVCDHRNMIVPLIAPYLLELEIFFSSIRQCTPSACMTIRSLHAWQIIDLHAVSVAAQRTPTISYISQEQIKDIGETVELQCSVQYGQEYPVLWIKVNKESVHEQVALSTGTALIIRDSRFALKYDTASTSYFLQVRLQWNVPNRSTFVV